MLFLDINIEQRLKNADSEEKTKLGLITLVLICTVLYCVFPSIIWIRNSRFCFARKRTDFTSR